ncbi:hypothetical protein Sjap_015310 [Stephania japonica]|uniref:Uncharacterized protein n=1 Tax=Stephania japonica TaxID=461633 RepID=A0AAP0NR92_9MAGN
MDSRCNEGISVMHCVDVSVAPDGNYRFRRDSRCCRLQHQIDEGWRQVWLKMFEELIRNEAMNMNVFEDVEFGKIRDTINFYDNPAKGEYWLSLLEMGIIVANHYKLTFVVLAKEGFAL